MTLRAGIAIGVLVLMFGSVGAYWLATSGIPSAEERATWIEGALIAHRGLHTGDSERPENSLAAFRAAVRSGYPIELDVHLSADGEVVVFHDDTLERMTGDPRPIADVTLDQLSELTLLESTERIPTLGEVLDLVEGDVPVLVEIKSRGTEIGPLERAVVGEVRGRPGEIAIQSFNPFSLAEVRAADPRIPRGQLASRFEDEDLAFYEVFMLRSLMMNWKSRPDFIGYELDGLPTLGTRLQQVRGRPLIGWTARTPEDMEKAAGLCDGVIFDPGALD